jgi:hypothetical protein
MVMDQVDDGLSADAVGVVGADPLVGVLDKVIAVRCGERGCGGVRAQVTNQLDGRRDGVGGRVVEDIQGAGEVLSAGAGDSDLAGDGQADKCLHRSDYGPPSINNNGGRTCVWCGGAEEREAHFGGIERTASV